MIKNMDKSYTWSDVVKATAGSTLKVYGGAVTIPFADGSLHVMRGSELGVKINDVFTGEVRHASYGSGVEYVRRLRMLPTPTSLPDQLTARMPGVRVGEYWKLNFATLRIHYSYVCNEYLFMYDAECLRIFTPGQMVKIGHRKFPYRVEALIDGIERGWFKD
jgi:hypothetical protein